MIGAVLHLWGRVVDRLAGADAASLRVMLAALSARVAAAEGEAARLRHRLWEADARAVSLQEKIDDWDRRYLEADRGNHAAEKKLTAERDEARAEVERLRAELAGLRQTDHDVRTWCEQAADAMDAAYAAGFRYGVDHPGEAFRDACDLGVYLDDQQMRAEWNHGRQDEIAARRLGEDTRAMADAGVQGPSLTDPALVIARLLDERDAARVKVERLRADAEATAAQSIAEWGRLKGRVNEAMDACDQMAKERDEALQWRGVAASVEREAAEDRARLEEAIRERDEARDTVRDLSYKLDAAGHEWFEAEKERDAARAEVERLTRERDAARGDRDETRRQIDRVANERDDLRRLAREVVKQMGNADGSPLHRCDKKCGRLATWTAPDDIVDLCDDCCDGSFCLGLEDTTHAAAWRALVAALPTETP